MILPKTQKLKQCLMFAIGEWSCLLTDAHYSRIMRAPIFTCHSPESLSLFGLFVIPNHFKNSDTHDSRSRHTDIVILNVLVSWNNDNLQLKYFICKTFVQILKAGAFFFISSSATTIYCICSGCIHLAQRIRSSQWAVLYIHIACLDIDAVCQQSCDWKMGL